MSKLYAKLKRAELHAMQERIVARALLDTGRNVTGHRSAEGDEQRLRMIPAIGACPGAIPGTRPDTRRTPRR